MITRRRRIYCLIVVVCIVHSSICRSITATLRAIGIVNGLVVLTIASIVVASVVSAIRVFRG